MFDYIALLLVLAYSSLFIAGVLQLRQIIISRKFKLRTIRNGIIFILTFSALLRIIFWCKVATPSFSPNQLIMVIYFLPVWMDFAGLSLLAVFYAETLLGGSDKYKQYKYYPIKLCAFVNFIFFLLSLLISVLLNDKATSASTKESIATCFSVYAAFLDFLLSGLLGFLGYKFYDSYTHRKISLRILPRSIKTFALINWYVVFAYVMRGLFTAAVGSERMIPVSEGEINYNGHHRVTAVTILFFFIITEWLPSVCILFLLWRRILPKHFKRKYNIYNKNREFNVLFALIIIHRHLLLTHSLYKDGTDTDTEGNDGGMNSRLLSKDNERISIYYDNMDQDGNTKDSGEEMNEGILSNMTGHIDVDIDIFDSEDGDSNREDSVFVNNSYDTSGHIITPPLPEGGSRDSFNHGNTNSNSNIVADPVVTAAIPIRINQGNNPNKLPWNISNRNSSVSPSSLGSNSGVQHMMFNHQAYVGRNSSPAIVPSREPSPSLSSSYTNLSKSITDKYTAPSLSNQSTVLQQSMLGAGVVLSRNPLPFIPEEDKDFLSRQNSSDINTESGRNDE